MRLDHVSYVADHDHLVDVVQRIGSSLGAAFQDGGIHPRFGTRNFILPLHGGTYLEVVCPLDHPATDASPFGQAVSKRAGEGGGWLTWVVEVTDIKPVEARVGRDAVKGHRRRPDGFDLEWYQLGVKSVLEDPQLPFFVQWLTDREHHPSNGANGHPIIEKLEIAGEPQTISAWLGEPENHPLDNIEVTWIDPSENDGELGLVAVHLRTDRGTIRLD